jgi:6-pyruvoyltetrahydropterin/6-carboxytetrahydropterin synthase
MITSARIVWAFASGSASAPSARAAVQSMAFIVSSSGFQSDQWREALPTPCQSDISRQVNKMSLRRRFALSSSPDDSIFQYLVREAPVRNSFRVIVSKDYLTFSSAHFITFSGHQCESLHGHNYRVGVSVEGEVDPECAFVVDFAILKEAVRGLVKPMDHRVLLPTKNPKLGYQEEGDSLVVDYFGQRRFIFPRSDCALLPITNTTAEMIAEYLAEQVREHLVRFANLAALEIEVEESVGQAAYYRAVLKND